MPPVESSGLSSRSTPDAIEHVEGHGSAEHRLASIADSFFTALAHASGNLDEDLPVLLQVTAECLGFEVATMWWWKTEEGVLRCEHVWQTPTADCTAFLDLGMHSPLAIGEPVPGVGRGV